MNSLTLRTLDISKRIINPLLLLLGVVLLLGTWVLLYQMESFFTESHLRIYYCEHCAPWPGFPPATPPGALELTVSDFFRGSPGKHLPSVVFVAVNISLFASRMLKVRRKTWLPFLFVLLNGLYLAVDSWLVGISWSISQWVVGSPHGGAYRGYAYTWYGIVLHLLLWGIFFFVMGRVSLWAVKMEHSRLPNKCMPLTA